jgi:hypothetical protein
LWAFPVLVRGFSLLMDMAEYTMEKELQNIFNSKKLVK